MVTIPLYIILFIYIVYISILGVFSFVNFSHLFHNGALTITSFLITFFIAASVATILFFTFTLLNGVDWQQPLTLWNNDWIANVLKTSNF